MIIKIQYHRIVYTERHCWKSFVLLLLKAGLNQRSDWVTQGFFQLHFEYLSEWRGHSFYILVLQLTMLAVNNSSPKSWFGFQFHVHCSHWASSRTVWLHLNITHNKKSSKTASRVSCPHKQLEGSLALEEIRGVWGTPVLKAFKCKLDKELLRKVQTRCWLGESGFPLMLASQASFFLQFQCLQHCSAFFLWGCAGLFRLGFCTA